MRAQTASSAPPPATVATRPSSPDGSEKLHATRAGRAWSRVLPALLLLGVILLFVFQNLQQARVSFVTESGRLPLGLALLAAAAFGALFVLALGSTRIMQLRKIIRRSRMAHSASARGL
jgi:uncharacterized integral membrane protein